MNPVKRTAIVHWMLGLGSLTAMALLWPEVDRPLEWWVAAGAVMALAAGLHLLPVQTGLGAITFIPAAALAALLTLGLDAALASTTLGLLAGATIRLAMEWNTSPASSRAWWRLAGQVLFPAGVNAAALLAAGVAGQAAGLGLPLTAIRAARDALPLLAAASAYVLVVDLILTGDLALAGRDVMAALRRDWPRVLGVQVPPMVLAPLAAVAFAQLGVLAFLACALILAAVTAVVWRLTLAQERLADQVGHLRSFSAMGHALRTSLEVDELLNTTYLQTASLLSIRNLLVVLNQTSSDGAVTWQPAFAMLAGNPVKNPAAQPVDGFVRWVLAEKTGLLAESAAHTAQQFKITNPPAARTWIGVPLMSSGMVLGCMATWLDEGEQPGRTFGQRESETFTTIAAQVGAALANALLYREAQHHAAQLSKLNHISAVLNAARYPEKLLELVANSAIDVAGCDKVAIYLLDQDVSDPALILAHAKAFSPEHLIRSRDIAVPLTPTERRKVMDEGTSVRVHNIHAEDADISPAMMLLAAREKFSAYAHLPLRAQDRSIGMLAIYYDEPHAFAPGDLGLLETFANQAALAIANAQFFRQVDSQLTRHTDQAVRMSNITQRLNASLDLDQIFNLIIESAIEGCGADSGVLVLAGSPELDYSDISHPHMVAWRGFDPANTVRAPHMIAEELAKSPVLQKGEPRLVSHDDPKESSPRSQLGVPIFLEGEVTGAIVLESAILNAFTHDDLSFVGQLAVQAAIAIRNAKLYRHAQAVRDRLHAILDASNDGLLMFDPRMRIIMTNTRMGDFWDFARSDFSPPSPDQFIADPTSALGEGLGYKEGELQALVRRGIKNPQIKAQTDLYSTTGPGGHGRRFVERTATPVRDERGSFIGLLLIFRDVTDQKELEETRQTLTSMIVHDLRSPLQAVMGSMRLIAEVSPEGDPVIDQATEVSKRAVKKLLNLVNNLLDLSRMEQGEFVLDPGIEQVRPILADVVEEVLPLAREMDAVVQLEVPDSLPYIRVDRDMVGRVALNLLDNALKYTEPGTLVKVGAEVRRKGEDDRQKDDMVCVFVADQGPGIPDEYKAAIFDRFAQVPGRKGRRRSAGLGLAFCQLAVESHGGRIWVEDGTEGGSVFKFTLPITAAPPEEHDEDEEPLPAAPAAQPPDSPSPPGEDKPAS